MNPRLDVVTVSCRDARALSAFWSALLGTTVRGEFGQYVGLVPVGGVRMVFQQVDDPGPAGRTHVDLDTHDLEADTALALSLGATVVQDVTDFGVTWRVLADPEGNAFCLVPA